MYLHPSGEGVIRSVKIGIAAEGGIARFLDASTVLGQAGMLLADHKTGDGVLKLLDQSLGEIKRAQALIRTAQDALKDYAHWLDANRNQDYEEFLQRAGFRGSYLILAEYKEHLDRLGQTLTGVVERWPIAVEAAKEGVFDEFLRDFSPGANAAMRLVCREAILALTFLHQIAETRYVFLDYRKLKNIN